MRKSWILATTILIAALACQPQAEARRIKWRMHTSHHTWYYELAPIKAKRGEFLKVLNACRQKYGGASDVNAEFTGHYGQHGWFCAYKY
jgi:hypothetical protein